MVDSNISGIPLIRFNKKAFQYPKRSLIFGHINALDYYFVVKIMVKTKYISLWTKSMEICTKFLTVLQII